MAFAADFVAIDFETANRRRDSACQLAAVTVRGGSIVDRAMWMIRPVPMQFSPGNIRIHGITPDRVADEPTFGEIWRDVAGYLEGQCVVAHNASFDIGVLLACLTAHRCDIPELQYTCTRAIARRCWPHRRRFGLKPLAEWLGINFRHHDALEDSIACAKILLAAGVDRRSESLEDLEQSLELNRGSAGDWGTRGPASRRRSGASRRRSLGTSSRRSGSGSWAGGRTAVSPRDVVAESPTTFTVEAAAADLQRLMVRGEFTRPLSGIAVRFVGKLCQMDADSSAELVGRLGGRADDGSADLIVYGRESAGAVAEAKTAADAAGVPAIAEADFLQRLGSGTLAVEGSPVS